MSQEVSVNEDGEKIFGAFSTLLGNERREEASIKLSDFLPENVVLRPQDITVNRALTADGGEMSMTVEFDAV